MTCELCGFEFDAGGLACHTGCPVGSKCSLICCPNCGYQEVDETRSVVARTLFRLWPSKTAPKTAAGQRPAGAGDAVPLAHLAKGASAEVRSLDGMPESRLARLSAFGLVPGTEVLVRQRRPVPVIALGETELAVNEEILAQIWVVPS
jgi:Fe2+ transport system protein FeoA